MSSKYTLAGITDEVDTCECCGRKDLKRTVALADETGEVVFYGTECAAKALEIPAADVTKGARKAQRETDRRAQAARQKQQDQAFAAWVDFLRRRSGMSGVDVPRMITACGGFAAARAAFAAEGKQ